MDRKLVERARSGDHDAFEVLAAGIVDHLYGVARPSLREVDRFDAWLGRLLMHAINDEFRRGSRFRANITVLAREPSTTDATSTAIADRELLDRGFARLSLEHRSVVVLRLHLGLSIEETASTLGIPVGTAKSRLHYATEALRRALEADAEPRSQEVSA